MEPNAQLDVGIYHAVKAEYQMAIAVGIIVVGIRWVINKINIISFKLINTIKMYKVNLGLTSFLCFSYK